jgi:hypothetical protein
MDHDTVLRACEQARINRYEAYFFDNFERLNRQYFRFHDWLVRHDARLTGEVAMLRGQVEFWKNTSDETRREKRMDES